MSSLEIVFAIIITLVVLVIGAYALTQSSSGGSSGGSAISPLTRPLTDNLGCTGFPCKANADCTSKSVNSFCQKTGCCYGIKADGTIDTTAYMVCSDTSCSKSPYELGCPCTNGSDCSSGNCFQGHCVSQMPACSDPCKTRDPKTQQCVDKCPAPQTCDPKTGACSNPKVCPDGYPTAGCKTDAECQSKCPTSFCNIGTDGTGCCYGLDTDGKLKPNTPMYKNCSAQPLNNGCECRFAMECMSDTCTSNICVPS